MAANRERATMVPGMEQRQARAAERVLVIDDDVELCRLVTRFMIGEGFMIDCVTSGNEGVARALVRSGKYDCYVLNPITGTNLVPAFRGLKRPVINVDSPIDRAAATREGMRIKTYIGKHDVSDNQMAPAFYSSGTGKFTSFPYDPPLRNAPAGNTVLAVPPYCRMSRRRSPRRWPRPNVQKAFSRK